MAVAQLTEGHRTELAMTYAASQLGVPHSLSASALAYVLSSAMIPS